MGTPSAQKINTMTYHIEEIAQVLGAHRVGTSEAKINWLLIDSRSLCFPEETLFFALKTSKNDGHRYIGGLYRRGVRNFVVSLQFLDDNAEVESMADANFLAVESPLKALQTRIKLKIHAFVRRYYGVDSILVKEYIGLDYVDMIFKFFRIAERFNVNTSLK